MNKLKASLVVMTLVAIMFFGMYWWQTIENRSLENENHKFQNEVNYLKGKKELLEQDNVKFQDALWHYHDTKMKEESE